MQSVKPPVFEPRSAHTRPARSMPNVAIACSSFWPARETNGPIAAKVACDAGAGRTVTRDCHTSFASVHHGSLRQNVPIVDPNGKFWEVLGSGRVLEGLKVSRPPAKTVQNRAFPCIAFPRSTGGTPGGATCAPYHPDRARL